MTRPGASSGDAALLLVAALALASCRAGEVVEPGAPPPVPGTPRVEPSVRVGILVDSASAMVSATTRFEILAGDEVLASVSPNEVWTFSSPAELVASRRSRSRSGFSSVA